MGILLTIVIGFIIGLIARFFLPGRDPLGFVLTTVIGVAGAIVASFGGQMLGWYQQGQTAGFIASVFGAVAVLAVLRFLRRE